MLTLNPVVLYYLIYWATSTKGPDLNSAPSTLESNHKNFPVAKSALETTFEVASNNQKLLIAA